MKLFRWQPGRQGTGYRIFPFVFTRRLRCDAYVIHYPEGSEIPPHRDPVDDARHFRVNVEVWRSTGGVFTCEQTIFSRGRVHVFRPDISTHSVSRVMRGSRVVVSFGFALPHATGHRLARAVAFADAFASTLLVALRPR